MKKHLATLLLIIVFLTSGRCYSQQLPGFSVTQTKALQSYMKSSTDSLHTLITAEWKKALKDSMSGIPYLDTIALPLKNGKVTVNYKPSFDSSGKVQTNLNLVNSTLTNNINTVSARVTVTEGSIASLNTNYSTLNGRVIVLESKVATINTNVATLQEQIKNVPTKATTITTSTSTTTLSQ